MLKILAVVVVETILITLRDFSIGFLITDFNFGSTEATIIFILVCCFAALAL